MIYYVPYEAGPQVISEAHRALQRDGVLRTSAPNADVIGLLPISDDPDVEGYIAAGAARAGQPESVRRKPVQFTRRTS
jgi:hypothetical protein